MPHLRSLGTPRGESSHSNVSPCLRVRRKGQRQGTQRENIGPVGDTSCQRPDTHHPRITHTRRGQRVVLRRDATIKPRRRVLLVRNYGVFELEQSISAAICPRPIRKKPRCLACSNASPSCGECGEGLQIRDSTKNHAGAYYAYVTAWF